MSLVVRSISIFMKLTIMLVDFYQVLLRVSVAISRHGLISVAINDLPVNDFVYQLLNDSYVLQHLKDCRVDWKISS